jgi:hypothetical protein
MKKTLFILGLALLPVAVFAQGQVNFANANPTRLSTNSTALPPPGQLPNQTGFITPNNYTIGFYVAPQGTTDPNAFTLVNPTTPNNGFPGVFSGNGATFFQAGFAGTFIAFQVRAWSTFAGATYDAAVASLNPGKYLGASAIGEIRPTASSLDTVPQVFGTSAGQVGGFVLTPTIPEPSSIALGLLGLGAIALFRRRK